MKIYKIVHLDDHKLITVGIAKALTKAIPDSKCISFTDTDDALNYMTASIEKNERVDLFITDFNHPGLNGYEFAKTIRQLEKKKNRQPIPILLLTMLSDSLPIIQKGLKQNVFNKYLPLSSSELAIVNFAHSAIHQ